MEPRRKITCLSESETRVIVYLDHLLPAEGAAKSSDSDVGHTAHNGEVDVHFFKQSFNLKAKVREDKNTTTHYKLNIVRLPSEIEHMQCRWKVAAKGEVEITLILKKQVDAEGNEFYCDWKSIVISNGLDQYDSSEDEEGNVPDPVPITHASDRLEQLGLEVVPGKINEFHMDEEDFQKIGL